MDRWRDSSIKPLLVARNRSDSKKRVNTNPVAVGSTLLSFFPEAWESYESTVFNENVKMNG